MTPNASARPEQISQTPVCGESPSNVTPVDDLQNLALVPRKIRDVINGIDSMCQTQLGQINAMITSMLRAMETPAYWRHPLVIRDSLGLMKYLVSDLMNFVNSTAEDVGCNFVDDLDRERENRVLTAFREAARAEDRRAREINEIAPREADHA
ncbi:hypothetical protein PWP93_28180 [Paraburkholderia sp. A1RI-2L]|uniref:hypothetical protein n=1 Tax=Paraburkholderia sp. A1RI-2L TaxID=3028367 RepID=UPI003B7BAEA3